MKKAEKEKKERVTFQGRISDSLLRKQLNELLQQEADKLGTEHGAMTNIVNRLLQKAIDSEDDDRKRIDLLTEQLAELRVETRKLREDFAYCLQTVLVAGKLAPPADAREWVEKYFRDGGLSRQA